jgi:glycosyltransferase involved in cell wall biosynthesis
MRILALTSLYPNPFQPTLGTFNYQQFRALASLHALRIIAPISWTRELSARWRGKGDAQGMPPLRQVERDGVPIEHPRYLFPPKFFRGLYGHCYRRSVSRVFHRVVSEFKPDVVLGAWAYPDGWAAVKLAHAARLPIALKVHGSDILTIDRKSPKWPRTAEALTEAETIIAVSQDIADKVAGFGIPPEKVRVVYNGVDSNLFRPGPMEEARQKLGLEQGVTTLLYIGNLFPMKGVDVLIDACEQLKKRETAFKCYIVGSGEMRPSLEAQIKLLGLGEEVKLMGSKPHRDLPVWFRAADVFVLPSYSEGVPNVLLEAVACGTRYVASRVGGIPEISHLGMGWLVPPGDVDALAAGIRSSLDVRNVPFAADRPQMRGHVDAAQEVAASLERAVLGYEEKAKNCRAGRVMK